MNLYRSHKPVGHEGRFYLYPSKKTPSLREKDSKEIFKGSPSWSASNTPIGHNELGKIVKELCTRVGQPVPAGGLGKWGGQGLRRTALTNCAEGEMNDTKKMKAGGHRSKQGLMKYIDRLFQADLLRKYQKHHFRDLAVPWTYLQHKPMSNDPSSVQMSLFMSKTCLNRFSITNLATISRLLPRFRRTRLK